MRIILGSSSRDKHDIVKSTLRSFGSEFSNVEIIATQAPSEVVNQPLCEETAIEGAINRSRNAVKFEPMYNLSLGLEGGLTMIKGLYHLVCVAAVLDKEGNIFIGLSKKLALPSEVSHQVESGAEFGTLIREYFSQNKDKMGRKEKESFEELIGRRKSFKEALEIAISKYLGKIS